MKAAGFERIEGRIIGDDDALEEPRPQLSWAWDDLGYTTGALFGALNLAENRTVVSVAPGPVAGAPAKLTLDVRADGRPILNRAVTGPAGTASLVWPEQRPGETALTIAGSIPVGAQATPLGISTGNPTLWFASVLRRRLIEEGIIVTGDAVDMDDLTPAPDRAAATTLFTYQSPTLAQIARPLLKDSINLYGEAFMRLNAEKGAFPTNDAALEGLRKRLAAWGLPEGSYQLVDGSGLSRRDAITPEAILTVLRRMSDARLVALRRRAASCWCGRFTGDPDEGNGCRGERSSENRNDVEYPIDGRVCHSPQWRTPGVRDRDQQLRGDRRCRESGDR